MLRSRFLWQVWGILGVTLVASTLIFGFFVSSQVERDAIYRIEQSLLAQALELSQHMSTYLESGQLLEPEQVNRMTPGVTARITLIDSEGKVILDNRRDPAAMDNHASRPEVIASTASSYGVSTRFSDTVKQSMHYLALEVRTPSGKRGYLRLALPLTAIEEQMTALRLRITVSAVLVGLLSLLVAYFLAYRVTRPITRMTRVASDIAQGEYHLRVPVDDREDEIGQLAAVVNELALGAQSRIDELTSNRNRLAAVLAGLTEGVIALDLSQRVQHVNEAALSILGVQRKEILNQYFNELSVVRELRQMVRTSIDEETSTVSTIRFNNKTIECNCVIIEGDHDDDDDEGRGAVLVMEDVTERLRLEEVRSDFVANASHELKTPISAIRGLIETIIDDPEMPQDIFNRFVERIRQQTIRLDNIVQDLLQLSRFDSSEREKAVTRLDLAGLLRQVYQSKSYDATDAGVEFELDLQVDSLAVDGEAEALNQLVSNLVENAIKYTGDGGRVQLRLMKVGAMAHIEVQDNGIGISKDETQRIFERFYRVDRARSRDLGGTGLGLAIVKHIAQAHNGSVTVVSQLGRGSRFTVQLPLALNDTNDIEPQAIQDGDNGTDPGATA